MELSRELKLKRAPLAKEQAGLDARKEQFWEQFKPKAFARIVVVKEKLRRKNAQNVMVPALLKIL